MTARTPKAAPTPIPALAPVERPLAAEPPPEGAGGEGDETLNDVAVAEFAKIAGVGVTKAPAVEFVCVILKKLL
jgi:hypothetical protein